ncbi:MAG: hypothetical protein ABUT20_38955 [Bacteroidota bacterium]
MKKFIIGGCMLLSLFAFRNNTGDKNKTAEIRSAVSKSLSVLQVSSHVFLKNVITLTNCHSCHNQGLGVVTFALAKENGFTIADSIFNEAIDSTCNFYKITANLQPLAENDDPVATTMTGNYDLWGLSAAHVKSTKTIDLLARNIMRRQSQDGSWVSPGQRPPLEYYTFSATALAIKNIQAYTPPILHKEVMQRVAKAREWLINNKPEANEEKIFQLLGLVWSDADKKIIATQADKLLAAQRSDGGWSQLDSLKSDAYATGQSLYALNQSGQLAVDAPAYQRGIDFLLRTQFADGSWLVKTRSYPFVPFVDSGFPHDKDQFISAAGSNWTTMALIAATKNL